MRNSLSHCFSEMEPLTFRIVAHIKLLPFVTLIPPNSVMLIMWLRCVALRWSSFTTPSCHLYLTILQMLFRSLSISLYILNFYFFENILKKKITSSHLRLRLRLPNNVHTFTLFLSFFHLCWGFFIYIRCFDVLHCYIGFLSVYLLHLVFVVPHIHNTHCIVPARQNVLW